MERFFHIKDWWGNGITLWVVGAMLFSAPGLFTIIRGVSLENDVTTWLPHDDPDARSLDWFSNEFEKENRLVLSWESSSLNDPRVEVLAEELRRLASTPHSGLESVTTPHDLIRRMEANRISQTSAISRLRGVLVGNGFLKVRLTPAGQVDRLASESLIQSVAATQLGTQVEVLLPVPRAFPDPRQQQRLAASLDEITGSPLDKSGAAARDTQRGTNSQIPAEPAIRVEIPPHDFQLRWPEMRSDGDEIPPLLARLLELRHPELETPLVEAVFFSAGAPVAITVGLDDSNDDVLAETVRTIEAAAAAAGIPESELRLAGSPISRIRLSEEARRAVWNTDHPVWNPVRRTPILLSALVSVTVSFILLRSLRLSLLVTFASVYTCLIIVALIPLTGKSLNMVLIVLPDLLLVLTTSGAIHVANYWKHAVTQGEEHPTIHAVKMAWQPCLLASLTTAIGMASLLTGVLEPVQEFGFYASIGCLISLAMILIGFPSLMVVWPGRGKKFAEHAAQEATNWGHFARKIVRHRRLITTGSLCLFAFSVVGLQWFQTETKVIRYFPEDSRISRDYRFLEEGLSGIVSVDTVIRFDQSSLEGLNISDRMELVRQVEQQLATHPWISGTISLADFRDPVVPPSADASTLQKVRYGRTLQRLEKGIFEEQAESASQFAKKATHGIALRTHTGRRIEIASGEEIWRVHAQSIITTDVDYSTLTTELEAIVSQVLKPVSGTDYLVTGMVPLFLRTQQAVLESLIKSFGLAFIVIAVVMMILLRSPTSGFLAMLPNLFPVGVVFGLVSWLRIPVDIGTMITASVALGIAIDGTLHLLTWYRDGIRHGLSREDSVVLGLQHCGPAMWQTSATIALGMVMLWGADLLLISRFGLLMAGLVGMALVADVVLLPALLGGWLGAIIAKKTPVSDPQSVPVEKPETLEFRPERENESADESTVPSYHVRVRTNS